MEMGLGLDLGQVFGLINPRRKSFINFVKKKVKREILIGK